MRSMRERRSPRRGLVGLWIAVVAVAGGAGPDDRPRSDDDWTFRPTVLVRNGSSQGSGTVIASVKGETLVLTAAHVVKEPGLLRVEFHRYNLGIESRAAGEGWPLAVKAEVAGTDVAADIAILRIRRLPALPFVARLAAGDEEPALGTLVTSVGIDRGTHLSSWDARVVEVAWFEMDGEAERPFLITTKPPEFGRSGGGLFLENGDLVGVCIGRAEIFKGAGLASSRRPRASVNSSATKISTRRSSAQRHGDATARTARGRRTLRRS